jgi:glycosyltransferase involved in cell wall biosynthesis
MNILEVYASFLPNRGGVQTHIYDLCKCSLNRGHKPIVLVWRPPKPSFEVIEKIMVYRFHMPLLFRITRYLQILHISSQMFYLVRRCHIDLIHAHSYLVGLASVFVGKLLHRPVVVTIHLPTKIPPSLFESLLKKLFLYSVETVVCVSKFTYKQTLKLGFPSSKLRIIYNWTTEPRKCKSDTLNDILTRFNLHSKRFILSVGRLIDYHKGFSILIGALKLLLSKGYDLKLVIVGDGPDRDKLTEFSLSLGVRDRVHFLRQISDEDLTCLYEACDIFTLASRFEAFGLVLLEAMFHRKTVIATNVGGIPEIIKDGYNGILVKPSPNAFAKEIETLINNPNLKEVFAKRSRETVLRRFSEENRLKTLELLEVVYRQGQPLKDKVNASKGDHSI